MINICRTTMVILVALAFGACGMMGSSNDGMSSQPSRNVVKSQPGAEMKVGDASPEARLANARPLLEAHLKAAQSLMTEQR
jgi:hypothetical protein